MKFERAKLIYISDHLAEQTAALLDSFAVHMPSEGVVYWFGIESTECAVVTTLVVPDADTSDGSIRTSVQANAAAIGVITNTPLVYLGQAHSHPGPNVRHSDIDNHETFARFEGALSLVVPWFGRYGIDLDSCGVYRHVGGRFREVDDVAMHLKILPSVRDLRQDSCANRG